MEMLVYVGILVIISLLLINTVFTFSQSYRGLSALRLAEHSGIDSMERMTRDIRQASSVDSSHSTFGGTAGVLTLVSTSGGFSTTTKFYLSNSILKVDVNGVYFGPLSLSSSTVTALTFTLLSSAVSDGVKVDMTVQSTSGVMTKIKKYHSTIILKGQ